jgi:hypothetical protein
MIEIFICMSLAICFVLLESFFISDVVYEKYHTTFVLLNTGLWVISLICALYLIGVYIWVVNV